MSNKTTLKSKPAHRPVTPPARAWWQSPIAWVVGLVLVAGLIAIIVATATGDNESGDASTSTAQTAFAEAIGSPLPLFAAPDSAIGMHAPTVNAQTLQGERVVLGDDATARIYGFFAHWCPHCQAELPVTTQWLANNSLPANVEVVAVSTAVDVAGPNYPPSDWFVREAWPATVLLDDAEGTLATSFGLTALPYWVAVDADGNVVARATGEMTATDLSAWVNQIDPAT